MGEPVGIGLVVAIFVSNLPEAIGSAGTRDSGPVASLVTTLGFAVATSLSSAA